MRSNVLARVSFDKKRGLKSGISNRHTKEALKLRMSQKEKEIEDLCCAAMTLRYLRLECLLRGEAMEFQEKGFV